MQVVTVHQGVASSTVSKEHNVGIKNTMQPNAKNHSSVFTCFSAFNLNANAITPLIIAHCDHCRTNKFLR